MNRNDTVRKATTVGLVILAGNHPVGSAERVRLEERAFANATRGCPCVCNSGGFCGGCGHAGCGGR